MRVPFVVAACPRPRPPWPGPGPCRQLLPRGDLCLLGLGFEPPGGQWGGCPAPQMPGPGRAGTAASAGQLHPLVAALGRCRDTDKGEPGPLLRLPHTPSSGALGPSLMDATQFPRASERNPPGGRPPAPPTRAGPRVSPGPPPSGHRSGLASSARPALPRPRLPPHRGSEAAGGDGHAEGRLPAPVSRSCDSSVPKVPSVPEGRMQRGHSCPFRGPDSGWLCSVGHLAKPVPSQEEARRGHESPMPAPEAG